jgi:hypothetical protein
LSVPIKTDTFGDFFGGSPGPWNGWLAPDGTFHECEWYGHDTLSYQIERELGLKRYVEDLGYVRLRTGTWYIVVNDLTQKQLDYVFDWEQANQRYYETTGKKSQIPLPGEVRDLMKW